MTRWAPPRNSRAAAPSSLDEGDFGLPQTTLQP